MRRLLPPLSKQTRKLWLTLLINNLRQRRTTTRQSCNRYQIIHTQEHLIHSISHIDVCHDTQKQKLVTDMTKEWSDKLINCAG
jgi:hypothetical protein